MQWRRGSRKSVLHKLKEIGYRGHRKEGKILSLGCPLNAGAAFLCRPACAVFAGRVGGAGDISGLVLDYSYNAVLDENDGMEIEK